MIVTGVHIKAGAEVVKKISFFLRRMLQKKHEIAWMYAISSMQASCG
jgi:hypothetical protein